MADETTKRPAATPAAGSTPSAADAPAVTTGLGAKVKDALKRVTTSEEEVLPPPSPDEEILEEGQKPKVVKFPSRELRFAFIALGTWAMSLSPVTKVIFALGMGIAIAIPIVIPILRHAPGSTKYYINRTEPLQPVPHPTAFEPLTELERNAEVEILKSEEGYVLVRTASARVGFVTKSSVESDRVEVTPQDSFTNCTVRWNEKSPSLCQLRATAQQEICSATCAEDGNQNDCTTACATNFALCMESCSGARQDEPEPTAAAAVPAAPVVSAPPTQPTAAATAAGAAAPTPAMDRPEGVVQLVPTKTEEEKKAKTKKRRKKKRRRRPADTATVRMPEME